MIVLVQPDAGGRISGGYLYNARMAAGGAWALVDLTPGELADGLEDALVEAGGGALPELVLADSIWLTEAGVAPFLRLRARGLRLGVVMHAFPSLIAAAERGREVPAEPTGFELEALAAFGLAVVPGRHYAGMLAGRAVRVIVAPPGIDDAWRSPPRPRAGRCELVSVGAVTRLKGFLDVAEVLARRPRRGDLAWTVVGGLAVDAAYAEAVRERARGLDGVVLAGQRPPEETRAIVQRSDVLVMPSYVENHPLVLLEAMAASVPAVAYAAGAAAHMLGPGAAGLVGPIGDRARLAANIERLAGDEDERYRMAQACWQRQRALPSWAEAARAARDALLADAR